MLQDKNVENVLVRNFLWFMKQQCTIFAEFEGFNKKEDQYVKILLELQGSSDTPDTFSVS